MREGISFSEAVRALDDSISITLGDLALPGTWAAGGRCRTAPSSIFFPERGDHASIEQARKICALCPVFDECREYALAAPAALQGVWAGMTGSDRRAARAERVAEAPAEHDSRPRRSYRGSLYAQLEQLTQHADRWARVVRYSSKHSGAAMASMLRNGQRTVPPGRWEFEGRMNDEGGSDVYARFVGEDAEGVA